MEAVMKNTRVRIGILAKLYSTASVLLRRSLWRILAFGPIPNHIAVILDGNRRYARNRGLSEGSGHRFGFLSLMSTLRYCYEIGVRYVTIYAFSIDNFRRRPDEVKFVMDLMHEKIEEMLKEQSLVKEYGVRVQFLGDLKLLHDHVRKAAEEAMAATAGNTGPVLSICVAYTSTDEIVHAVQECWDEKLGELRENRRAILGDSSRECSITLADLERHVYTAGCPEPNILIRTSGETRLSNFLLWQSSFCYLHISNALWPEFSLWDLVWAILQFQRVHPYLEKRKSHVNRG